MMLQLNPPIPLKTPKGDAWAHAMIDYGPQWDLLWVTFVEATGECWTFRNPEIRQGKNYTFGHPDPTPIKPRPEPQKEPPKQEKKHYDLPEGEKPTPMSLDFSGIPNFTPLKNHSNGHA